MKGILKKLFREDRGATILEYGLIIFIMSLAAVAALDVLGDTLNDLLSLFE